MDEDAKVLVFRNSAGEPIAVPEEVVTAGERAYRCHKMRLDGTSWAQIAIVEQYPSAAAAYADYRRYMEEAKALVVESSQREMMTLEVARLDELQHMFWPKADKGNVAAGTLCLNVIMSRAKLVGLDAERMGEAGKGRTVVVSAADGDYTRELQAMAGTDTKFDASQEQDSAVPTVTVDP